MSSTPSESKDATPVPNLSDLLESVNEMGGKVKITFSGQSPVTCDAEVILPGATLVYMATGDTENEALLAFAKKFQPTQALFVEQFAANYTKQIGEALRKFTTKEEE